MLSKSFDNGMICASEQAVIIDDDVYAAVLDTFTALHAHVATPDEKRKLEEFPDEVEGQENQREPYVCQDHA